MKRYWLLRDNRESGPCFPGEFERMGGLFPMDLVWTEGESHCWAHPLEVEELKGLVREPEKKPSREAVKASPGCNSGEEAPVALLRPLEPLRERYPGATRPKKNVWRRRISRSTNAGNFLRLAAVVIGLFPAAFIIQKLTNAYTDSENYTPPVVARVVPEATGENNFSIQAAHHPGIAQKDVEKSLLNPDAEKLKGTVTVKSNDYKVKILGGIENLKLTVYNESPWLVEDVLITVMYHRGNGKPAGTDQVEVKDLRPGSMRTIAVPPARHGVKVSYSITRIRSGQHTYTLKQV